MTSFQKNISTCCACFALAITAALLSFLVPGWFAPISVNGIIIPTWIWIGFVAAIVLLALVLSFSLRWKMRNDVRMLRDTIKQLATPEKDLADLPFAFEELSECAADLAQVASTLRQEQARLNNDATRDALTGLPNRRSFMETLTREMAFAQQSGWPLSLIMVDLDHFKKLNDTFGHQAGDFVLRRAAQRIDSLVRHTDAVARYGGEEFATILPGAKLEQAIQIAHQLRDALRCDQFVFEGHNMNVTASFGVAELHECGLDCAEALINCADQALYEAKERGRDTVVAGSTPNTFGPAPKAAPEIDPVQRKRPEENNSTTLDRDTMALMGSTYSMLQVIPDKHRVANDIIQQVAAVLQANRVRLFLAGYDQGSLAAFASIGFFGPDQSGPSPELVEWFENLQSTQFDYSDYCIEPKLCRCGPGRPAHLNGFLALISRGCVVAVVEAVDLVKSTQLSKRQQTVLTAICAIGATALQCCNAFRKMEQRMGGLIEALCLAIHSQDEYKYDHCQRVSHVAVRLAKSMGQQDEAELQTLRIAALVHDVGDIALPQNLLARKGQLRQRERKLMQQHPSIAAELIDGQAELSNLAEIVRRHHERFDGSGYPDGMAGDAIPIESRIIALADAYVAMVSPRPHREAMTHDQAVEQIKEDAGKTFDPAIVESFLKWSGSLQRNEPSSPGLIQAAT